MPCRFLTRPRIVAMIITSCTPVLVFPDFGRGCCFSSSNFGPISSSPQASASLPLRAISSSFKVPEDSILFLQALTPSVVQLEGRSMRNDLGSLTFRQARCFFVAGGAKVEHDWCSSYCFWCHLSLFYVPWTPSMLPASSNSWFYFTVMC